MDVLLRSGKTYEKVIIAEGVIITICMAADFWFLIELRLFIKEELFWVRFASICGLTLTQCVPIGVLICTNFKGVSNLTKWKKRVDTSMVFLSLVTVTMVITYRVIYISVYPLNPVLDEFLTAIDIYLFIACVSTMLASLSALATHRIRQKMLELSKMEHLPIWSTTPNELTNSKTVSFDIRNLPEYYYPYTSESSTLISEERDLIIMLRRVEDFVERLTVDPTAGF